MSETHKKKWGIALDYSTFFHIFYRKRRAGGLKGLTSKTKIVEFFFRNAMDDDGIGMLPTSDSSFDKWFDGDPKRKPSIDMWRNIVKCSKTRDLSTKILNLLNDRLIREIVVSIDVRLKQNEPLDKRRLAHAVAEQFITIAKGNGEADNIMPIEYAKKPPAIGFDLYLQEAVKKHETIHILGEDECLLKDYFVCNRICRTSMVFSNRSSIAPIENATLKKLRTFDSRGETAHIILIGNGGSGKTLMLKHLFLESALHHRESALLPVLVELRNFSYLNGDIVTCIVKCINEFDTSFTDENAEKLLLKGQCQILMDGLDEMDPSDINDFQRKLSEFVSRYPNNQIVITSRDCDAVKGIGRFIRLYISPLDSNQSMMLIDNLLTDDADAVNAKTKIIEHMNNGFIKKDGVFASNPMLLTYVVRHHKKLDEFSKDKYKFYSSIYDAIVDEHDVAKEAFDRIFKSVNDSEEFTDMFEEFCGKSYPKGLFAFDGSTFKNVFKTLKNRENLSNPSKCTMKSFQHDACSTACMMYEQDSDIYYVDPGFQEYMFAKYYFGADTKSVMDMGRTLRTMPISTFRNTDAFDMLYQKASKKVEVGMYLPYLEEIFKDFSDDDAFQRYILIGYGKFTYTVLFQETIHSMEKHHGANSLSPNANINEPNNMLHYLILRSIDEPTSIKLLTANQDVRHIGQESSFFVGFIEDDAAGSKQIKFERFVQAQYDNRNDPNLINYSFTPLCDDNGFVSCLGNDYMIDLEEQSSEDLIKLIRVIQSDAAEIYQTFLSVKSYYKKISKFQEINQFI